MCMDKIVTVLKLLKLNFIFNLHRVTPIMLTLGKLT